MNSVEPKIYVATARGDLAALRRCIAEGHNVDSAGGTLNTTPLMEASKNGSIEAVKILLEHGAKIEEINSNEWTALFWAAMQGHAQIVDMLITYGAAINKINKWGQSALSWAVCNYHPDVVEVLLERGVDTKICDLEKVTESMSDDRRNNINSLLEDHHVLKWNDLGLDNQQLLDKLNSLDVNTCYSMLLLNGNHLKHIPDLKQYVSLRDLTVLNISHNKIEVLDANCLPNKLEKVYAEHNNINSIITETSLLANVIRIDLSHNNIEAASDLSCCKKLEKLNLSFNAIKEFMWSKVPLSLAKIDLSYNKIEDLNDLFDFDCMKELNMQNNSLKEVFGLQLPPNLESINLSKNRIELMKDLRTCRNLQRVNVTDNNITKLLDLPLKIRNLELHKNPLEKIYKDSVSSIEMYTTVTEAFSEEMLSSLLQPPPEVFTSGFIDVTSYLNDLEDTELTQQALNSKKRLVLTGQSNSGKTSLVRSLVKGSPDLTDKDDSTQVIDIVPYQITDQDIYQLFDQGGQQIYSITNRLFISKESTVFVNHDISKSSVEYMDETLKVVKRALHQYPQNELHFVLSHIDEVLSEEGDNLEKRIADFKQSVKQLLLKEIDTIERLKESDIYQPDDDILSRLEKYYNEKLKHCQYFPVSCMNYDGVPEVNDFLMKQAAQKRVVLPAKWIECFKFLNQNRSNYISIKEFVKVFKSTYSKKKKLLEKIGIGSDIEDNAMTCLRYFNACGLVLWYEDNPDLQTHIFHKVEFLIDLLKSILHHNLEESLKYDQNKKLQTVYSRDEYEYVIQLYKHQGLLTFKLLKILWLKYHLHESDENLLLELMKRLNICHEIEAKELPDDLLLFFPWFVEEKSPPNELDMNDPIVINNRRFSLHLECAFHNDIPANVSEMLIVCLQKYAVQHNYIGERYAWADGLTVKEGNTEVCIYRYIQNSSLNICIRNNPESVIISWKVLDDIQEMLKNILQQFHGAIRSLVLKCSHCKLNRIYPGHRWLLLQCFPEKQFREVREVSCPNQKDQTFPSAVVTMVPTDLSTEKEDSIKDEVCKYLKRTWIGKFYHVSQTMYPEPVITDLFRQGLLSNDDKHQLEGLVVNEKVEYLLDRVLLVAEDNTKEKFKESLYNSECPTNVALARLLDDVLLDPDLYDNVFLTEDELDQMRRQFYAEFNRVEIDDTFLSHLHNQRTLDNNQFEEIRAMLTNAAKTRYLLDQILFRGIWETVCHFKHALVETERNDIADLLPSRDSLV